jgi:hypothetical protein
MCELIITEKARNVGIENDCCSCVYTAIGPEGMAFYQHFIVLVFSIDVIMISAPFISLNPLDEMSQVLVGVNSRGHLLMLI